MRIGINGGGGITASHSDSLMLTSIRSRRIPSLQTSTSTPPNASIADSIMRPAAAKSQTLSSLTIASLPALRISSTTSWAGVCDGPLPSSSPLGSFTTTLARKLERMLATNASSGARHDYAAALTDSCPDVSLIDGRRREKERGIQRMRERDVLLWYASASDPKNSRFFG